jgi:hypothetical protein
MATIGSISVAFEMELGNFQAGIDSVVSSLDGLAARVEQLSARMGDLSSASVSIDIDSSSVDPASRAVESLSESVEAATQAVETSSQAVRSFSSEVSRALSASSEDALRGTESYIEMRDSLTSLRDVATGTLNAISSTASRSSSAVTGLSNAVASLSGGGGLQTVADSSIVAAGRIFDAYQSIVSLFTQVIPNAFVATGAAVTTLASTMGGLATVSAAFAGSAAAASIVVGSLAAAAASAGVAILTYAGIVTAARIASSGLSEEAQAYVERAARVVGAMVSAAAAGQAAAVVYRTVATSLFAASSVSEGLANAMRSLAGSVLGLVPAAVRLANILGVITASLDLVDAASRRSTAGFVAVAARAAVFSTAIGAVTGGISAYVAGTSVMTGVTTGASAAIGGLIANFPIFTTLAVAAAVASGRVAEGLQHVGQAAQQMGDLADRFGQPVQEIEKLKIAAQNSGVALQSVVRAQQTFSQNLSKVRVGSLGSVQAREAKAAFDQLNLSAEDLRNQNPQDVFARVAREISTIPDPAKRTQIAMDLFGRTGPALLPMLRNLDQINADMSRLGGTISDLDFERFTAVKQSFDRLRTASGAMTDDLAIPFTRMQEAWNNARAEIIGGLAPLVGAFAEVIADMTTPFAVVIEIIGRVIGTIARLAAAAAKIITAFLPVAAVATVFELLGDVFQEMWSYVEGLVSRIEEFASAVEEAVRPSVEFFVGLAEAVTEVFDAIASLIGLGGSFIEVDGETPTAIGRITIAVVALTAAFASLTVGTRVYQAVMATAAAQSVVAAVTTAAAWVAAGIAIASALVVGAVVAIGVYVASVIAATATTIASCAAMHVAWLFGLGPIGLLVAGIELVAVAVVGLWALGSGIVDFFSGWGEGREEIDGATASVDELAEAVESAEQSRGGGMARDFEALGRAIGLSQEEIESAETAMVDFANESGAAMVEWGETAQVEFGTFGAVAGSIMQRVGLAIQSAMSGGGEDVRATIAAARDEMAELSIRAAQLGPAGEEAATRASESFNELQRNLANGSITLEEFREGSAEIGETLEEQFDAISKGSPEETLKKNIELFKELDGAAKQAAKSARDIGADVVIGDKIFPRSEEVKSRAKQYSDEYADAIDAVKKKLAAGGFQEELDARRQQNESDFASGAIDEETFRRTQRELDTTTAQEQASIAAEQVQRELDQKNAKLKVELDFADGIRKRLEEAFLSPVDKFQKELDKIQTNIDLTPEEKELAEKDLRKTAREQIIGQTATERFSDRERDISQALGAGLITDQEAQNEIKKNADELAKALGIPVNPANQMEVAVSQLDAALKAGKISVEQHAEGLKAARRSFLESLGIKPRAEELDADRVAELDKQFAAKKISEEEFQRGMQAVENDIVGQSAAGKISEQRNRINAGIASGAVDGARGEAALRGLDSDRRRAAGVDDSPAQQLQLGIDKINDAFGTTGLTLQQVQATLSPAEFAEYQEALKNNTDAVKASLGVEKTGAEQIQEQREKLAKAVADNVITQEEAAKAEKEARDNLLSSLGISKSPAEAFEDAAEKIRENAAELSDDEVAKGLKEAKDKLLSALGIPKSPVEEAEKRLEELSEAFGMGSISAEELAKGAKAAKDSLLQSLGIPLDPVAQFAERLSALDDALQKGLISQEQFTQGQDEARRTMLPGGESKSPLKQFQEDIDAITRAREDGLIDEEEFAQRRMNLQAGLEDSMGAALDSVGQDRRQVGASDARSQSGVDTFFRILQGRDNPSLKAQLEIAKNTKLLADAAQDPDAEPVIANFSAR